MYIQNAWSAFVSTRRLLSLKIKVFQSAIRTSKDYYTAAFQSSLTKQATHAISLASHQAQLPQPISLVRNEPKIRHSDPYLYQSHYSRALFSHPAILFQGQLRSLPSQSLDLKQLRAALHPKGPRAAGSSQARRPLRGAWGSGSNRRRNARGRL